MKKILPFIMLAAGSLFMFSCDNNDDVVQDYDTYSQMRDVSGSLTSTNNFAVNVPITIQNTDVVLVYRNVSNVWQPLPKNYYLDNVATLPTGRELEYNFVFDKNQVQIRTESNFNQETQMTAGEVSQYLNNQTFRVVLVPASSAKTTAVDLKDYNAVVNYYQLDESKIKTVYVK